ncbi:MMPL family transporter [Streptomyces sp. MAR4 CNX-425]|uniref:MMPL family transporter n=1 Tax=Streptomyces sp. MAR4 CNX-425 TaxID=3406343 RepID=UPI003B5143E0
MRTAPAAGTDTAQPSPAAGAADRYSRLVSGRRSKWAVCAIWILLIAVGGSLAAKLGSVQDNDPETWLPASAQSTQAVELAEEHFADKDSSTAVVVYARGSGLTAADLDKVGGDRDALASGVAVGDVPEAAVSEDGKAAFVSVPLRTSPSDNSVLGDGVDRVDELTGDGVPEGLEVRIAGEAGNIADYIDVYSGLDAALLGAALGVVAVLLLLTYRSPVLWLVPLLTVFLAGQVAGAVVYLLAKHAGLVVNGQSAFILTVLAIGVGTDYALLLIARYREELHRHEDRHEAMAVAVRRSLPAITASAATVGIATLCLVFGSMNSTRGLGPVVAIGVAVVYLAMTSLLPALLVVLGRWPFWPFIPRHTPGYEAGAEKEHGVWVRIASAVAGKPRTVWIGTAAVLAALAFGATTVETGQTQAEQFTNEVDSVAGQELLATHFPAGSAAPADIYVPDGGAADALRAVEDVPGVQSASTAASEEGWTHLTAVLSDAPDTAAARETVADIRTALEAGPGESASAVVGGQSAVALDTSDAQSEEEKLLIPLILGVVLVMLILLLRARVAPLVLLASVVLSYASAVGAASLLFHAVDHPRIDRGLLLFGFLFLVALGVDYTIFLMTRIREEVQRYGHRRGTLTGLTVTGGVITSAGLVLAATFCVLAAIPTVQSLQQGLLVAIGVLLDTFLVRTLLIPALSLEIGPGIWRPGRPEATPAPAEEKSAHLTAVGS